MASETENLKNDVAELQASINKLTKDMSTLSKSIGNNVGENAKRVADQARERGKQSADAVEAHVAENPFRSLLIAFGAGVVISQLIRRG